MGWVFPLLASVALTVVPMFLVTPAWPQPLARLLVPLHALTLLLIAAWPALLPLLMLPVSLFVLQLLRSLAASKRGADPARWLWAWGGVNLLLVCALASCLDALSWLDPVLLGGHSVVSGGLYALTEIIEKKKATP